VEHYARWLQRGMSTIVANPESDICGRCSHQPEVSLAREDIKAYWKPTSAGVNLDNASSFRSFVLGPVTQDFDLCRFELKHHKRAVNCVAYNFDGSLLASASEDKTVAIWNTKTGMVDCVLKGHTDKVTSVAWCMAPDNRQLLATSSADKTVRIWDVAAQQLVAELIGHTHLVTSVALLVGIGHGAAAQLPAVPFAAITIAPGTDLIAVTVGPGPLSALPSSRVVD
jgi:WD40 repeat protein